MKAIYTLLICILLTSATVNAEYVASHSCSKPYKPYEFTTQYQVDTYNYEIEDFRSCIEDFIEEQNDAIRGHQREVGNAIDDWNNFVNYQ